MLACRREHDFSGSETSKIEQKSQKNVEKTHRKKSNEKKQLFIDFWLILGPFSAQNRSKNPSETGSIFETKKGGEKKLRKKPPKSPRPPLMGGLSGRKVPGKGKGCKHPIDEKQLRRILVLQHATGPKARRIRFH